MKHFFYTLLSFTWILPAYISTQPEQAKADPTPDKEERTHIALSEELSPSMMLQKAFEMFRLQQHASSAEMFMSAVRTGALNDAGKTIAYWHAFTAYQQASQTPQSLDALASFITVSEELLQNENTDPTVSTQGFSNRFDLHRKLSLARAQQYAHWSHKNPSFGKSPERAIPIHSVTEIDYFLNAAQPCTKFQGQREQHVERMRHAPSQVDKIATFCTEEPTHTAVYYFQWVTP